MICSMDPPRILIAVDFSEASRRALEAGERLARDLHAGVVLAHAIAEVQGVSLAATSLGGSPQAAATAQARMSVDEALKLSAEWAQGMRAAGLEVETVAREGIPEDVVLQAAEDHDVQLLVVGSHGLKGFKRFVLGSVAQTLLHRSRRPVLVIPAAEAT